MKLNAVKITFLFAMVALLATSLPVTAQTELVVWHAYRGGEKAAFEKVVETFNASQGGAIKVTTLAVQYDAYADKITAAVPRGKGPDVFIYAQDRLGGEGDAEAGQKTARKIQMQNHAGLLRTRRMAPRGRAEYQSIRTTRTAPQIAGR